MVATGSTRIVLLCISLGLLTGCAGSAKQSQGVEDYFALQLPGMPASWNPMMSPVDNPLLRADSLHGPNQAVVREALLAQHRRWAGTPYRLGGTTERGIDCSALVRNVFSETFRLDLPRSTGEQVQKGTQVGLDELQVGDLVFFRPPGAYDHVGIYVGEGFFLHASTSQGVILSELDNTYWKRHFWQARRTLEPTTLAQRVADLGEG
ncbi:C40 family peptidase [Halomonas sp. E19]|uniref:C40 family peptidase n=1 Tax=unclassified Halomonas TaxID=2609666 RepID=UPI00403459DF